MPQTERAEPHLGAVPGEAGGEDELRRRHAFYNQFNVPPRNTGRRFPWRIALLVTATLGGLISTCWLDLTRSDVLPAMRVASSNAISSMTVDADGKVRMRKGIDRAELPNDGIPSEGTLAASAVSAASRQAERKPAEVAENTVGPVGPTANGVADASESASGKRADARGDDKDNGRAPAKAEAGAAGKEDAKHAATRMAGAEPTSSAKKSASASKKAKPAARAVAVTKQKARPVHRVARRDPEVERLRRQAEEELKKKTSGSVKLAEASSPSPHGLTRDISRLVRARFHSCTRAGNFFQREKCKWEVCGGMWGRNGCPSYRNGLPVPQ